MVDHALRLLLEHPKRKVIVITITLLTAIVFVWPAVEDYSAASGRVSASQTKLKEAEKQAEVLPQVMAALSRQRMELGQLEQKAVKEKDLDHFRDLLLKLIQETGCDMRSCTIDEIASTRPWYTNDRVLKMAKGDPGPETPFSLMTWNARLTVEGSMGNLHKFLSRLQLTDRFMVTTNLDLAAGQSNSTGPAVLNMSMVLFDLVKKKAT